MIGKFIFLCTFSCLILDNNSLGAEAFSLEDCISWAKEANLTLVQAKTAADQARADLIGAYSLYYPSIDLASGYRNGDTQGNYSTALGLNYQLYRGGYARAGVRGAQARVKLAEENYRLAESEVILSVQQAFFQILEKQEQIASIEDILKRRKENLVIIKLKYTGGTESSPAVKEAAVNVAQAEYDKMRAEEELRLAKVNLNLLIGRPKKEELSIRYQDKATAFPPPEKMIEEAQAKRPEVGAAISNQELLAAQVTQAKSNYLPTLSLSSSFNLQGSNFLEQSTGWSAGVNLSVPIFNGFSTRAKVQAAVLSLKIEGIKIQALQQTIDQEIEQAWSNWKLAEKNLEIARLSFVAQTEMYQLTKLQYEQGLTDYFFLQQKENSLTSAEYNRVTAQFNLRAARAQLLKAWGGGNQ